MGARIFAAALAAANQSTTGPPSIPDVSPRMLRVGLVAAVVVVFAYLQYQRTRE
ncbi:MAG: hypothetical protein ABEJ42_07730 [Halobacteriaceae archaeon]